MENIVISKDSLSGVRVIRPENATRAETACAELLAACIGERAGFPVAVGTPELWGDINLVVGNIGTPRSMNLCLPLYHNRYGIFVDRTVAGWDIYLAGQEEVAVWRACYLFRTQCIRGDGCLSIPQELTGVQESLFVRDPYILRVGDQYYTYLNYLNRYWVAYRSEDLLHWTDFTVVMDPAEQPKEFDAETDLWAPEVYEYRGKYYMFATYKRRGVGRNYRGCCILCADEPMGRFRLITNGLIVPQNGMIADGTPVPDGSDSWSCIDATFYVDENDLPWIVFSHEWVSTPHGGFFCAARLKEDLTDLLDGNVYTLFNSYDGYRSDHEITDGCYIWRTADGQLLMLWSNDTHKEHCVGYCVRVARSKSGNILGPWTHDEGYLYDQTFDDLYQMFDGGHGCIVKGPDNGLMLCIHSPATHHESIHLVPIREENGTLRIDRR